MIKLLVSKVLLRKSLLVLTTVVLTSLGFLIGDFVAYKQLTEQSKILDVSISSKKDGFEVSLVGEQAKQNFYLEGDEWVLDARLIRFQAAVAVLGWSNIYQLDRLSSRYLEIDDEKTKERFLYSLRDETVLDTWRIAKASSVLKPFIEAVFGSSIFLPLKDGAKYEVYIGYSGIVVKTASDEAALAIAGWLP